MHLGHLVGIPEIHHKINYIIVFPSGIVMADWYIPVIPHPAEKYIFAAMKAARKRLRTVMPFSCSEAIVPGLLEHLPHSGVGQRDILPLTIQMKQCPSGIEHGPAGHAHRAARSARDVGLCKSSAVFHQPVHGGRNHIRISQRMDSIKSLIVGQHK